MKLLFIASMFPDAASPARGTYNADWCCALAERHEVRAIAPRTFLEVLSAWRRRVPYKASSQLKECSIATDYPTYWFTPKCARVHYGTQMWWSVRGCVKRVLTEFQPDAVISYWAHPDGEVGLRTAELAGVPSIVIVGGTDVLLLPREPDRGRVVRSVLGRSSAVVGVSDGLRRATVQLGVPEENVHTIYQGVNRERFHPGGRAEARVRLGIKPTTKVILWVGRMVPVKRLDILTQAFATLRRKNDNIQLCLLGDGPERSRVGEMARSMNLTASLTFPGAVPHDRLADWYRAADVTVISSDSEGLPNVLRESLACGTPFVSTDVGSIREIADDSYSRLVPAGDPAALADALRLVLDSAFQHAAEQFQPRTWRDSANDMTSLIEKLTDERNLFEQRSETRRGLMVKDSADSSAPVLILNNSTE